MAAAQGLVIASSSNISSEVVYPIHTFMRTLGINDCPLISRLPRVQIGADKFTMGARSVRSRSRTLGAALADNTNTTVNLTDVSDLMIGDVIELNSGERVEITADPTITNATTGAGTVTVRRGIASTTAAAQNNATSATLIGNSRTGSEIDQTAFRPIQSYTTQYVQTFQFPIQTGGKVNAMSAISLPPGATNPHDADRILKMQEFMRDVEYAMLNGKGEFNATGGRSKMVGLRNLVANTVTSPTNSSAYKPSDFVRDIVTAITNAGGFPTTLVCASNWVEGFATWGHAVEAFTDGTDVLGLPIRRFVVPFLGYDLELVPHPQLANYTAYCLSMTDRAGKPTVRTRYIRQEEYHPRGNRGDAVEADIIGDFSIEVDNLNHHVFLSGVTAFSN